MTTLTLAVALGTLAMAGCAALAVLLWRESVDLATEQP